ncbi:beta-glucosidase A [Botrytis cinerea]
MQLSVASLLFSTLTVAQQVYIPGANPTTRSYCNASPTPMTSPSGTPTYKTSSFSYTLTETTRTAISVTPGPQTTHGLPYASVSSLFGNVSTTSWGNWYPNGTKQTDTANPYGNAAWSSLWDALPTGIIANFTRGIYTTTVSPTPIPTSELILPPHLDYDPQDCYYFPEDFVFGVTGAAAQVEGAIADEGKAPTTAEMRTLISQSIPAAYLSYVYPDGQVTNDFSAVENYYLYKQDITRLASAGVKYYAFSISWARIMPFVLPGTPVNSQGLQHYDDLINFIIEAGMQPAVTLLHNDSPLQWFGDDPVTELLERSYTLGSNQGFQSTYKNVTFQDAYVNYGKIVMSHFADRVPIWISFNEPLQSCINGKSFDAVIKSHARLHHFYHDVLNGTGKMSLKIGGTPGVPLDPTNVTHVAAAERYNDLGCGVFLNPLTGQDYPDAVKETWQDYVPLSDSDLQYLNGTLGIPPLYPVHSPIHILTTFIDFVSADLYSVQIVAPLLDEAGTKTCGLDNSTDNTLYPNCVELSEITANGWSFGYHPDYLMWNTGVYLRTQLGYFWNTYGLPVAITEFGLPSPPRTGETYNDMAFDVDRSEYYIKYMSEVLKAIWEDNVHVMGAFMWSWVDNWEWGTYYHHFGVMGNNLTSQERFYKRSLFDIIDFMEKRATSSSENTTGTVKF